MGDSGVRDRVSEPGVRSGVVESDARGEAINSGARVEPAEVEMRGFNARTAAESFGVRAGTKGFSGRVRVGSIYNFGTGDVTGVPFVGVVTSKRSTIVLFSAGAIEVGAAGFPGLKRAQSLIARPRY